MADQINPLREVASRVGVAWASASAIVGALVTYGVFTVAQGNAIGAVGAALPGWIEALGIILGGVIPLVGAIVSAFRTAVAGENHVTPVLSPRDNEGNQLTAVGYPVAGGRLTQKNS